jgi:uncharacterized phage-associated protein
MSNIATSPTMAQPAASAAAVANEFLNLASREAIAIDQMKLQKLLFYAHAWHLALKDRPLFEDDFEAWPWGPVVRDIYSQTRGYGRSPISGRLAELQKVGGNALDWKFSTPGGVDSEELKEFIREVWDTHKTYSGVQLSNSTHARGEPWTIIKDRYGDLDSKPKIPNEIISAVFKKKLDSGSQDPAA